MDFLSDRISLYEHLEYAALYGGTVTQNLGLNRIFSDYVCYEIDSGLAQWRLWYKGRMREQQKIGKGKWSSRYKDLNDVLGVTEALRRGGWEGKELTHVSGDYKTAVIEAAKKGLPPPDIHEWMAKQQEELTGVSED
jgi:hypothetical protein